MENSQLYGPILSVLVSVASAYLIFNNVKKSIVEDAKKEMRELEMKMAAMKEGFEKDITHVKSTYNSEVKNLKESIEHLRDELRESTGKLRDDLRESSNQMIELLSKLVSEK